MRLKDPPRRCHLSFPRVTATLHESYIDNPTGVVIFHLCSGHADPTPHISHVLDWGPREHLGWAMLGNPTSSFWVSPCSCSSIELSNQTVWGNSPFSTPFPKVGLSLGDKCCWQKVWHLRTRTCSLGSIFKLEMLMVAQRQSVTLLFKASG